MTVLTLPYPPTVNHLYKNVRKGRVKSDEYKAWLTEAYGAVLLTEPRPRKIIGDYCLTLSAERPDRRRRDLGNLLKATEDALVHCQVVEDDCHAVSILLEWADGPPVGAGAKIHLRIDAANPLPAAVAARTLEAIARIQGAA